MQVDAFVTLDLVGLGNDDEDHRFVWGVVVVGVGDHDLVFF